jgi:hypothetical protein
MREQMKAMLDAYESRIRADERARCAAVARAAELLAEHCAACEPMTPAEIADMLRDWAERYDRTRCGAAHVARSIRLLAARADGYCERCARAIADREDA